MKTPATTTTTTPATTTALTELYARYISFIQVSRETERTYNENLTRFFRYLQDNQINRPTRETILAYKQYLLANLSPATTALSLVALRGFFQWLEIENFYKDITKGIKAPKISRTHKKGYLNPEQIKALLNSLDLTTEQGARDNAIMLLMIACGLRCVEVSEALKDDLKHTANGLVLYIRGKGQTEKVNYIKIPAIVERAINHYLTIRTNKSNVLFASTSNNSKGKTIPPKTLSQIIKHRFTKSGLDSSFLTAHSLRHTAITLALIAGEKLEEVQAFARHKNITTTMIYNHALNYSKNTCSNSIANLLAL